jgi:hypothetical protein
MISHPGIAARYCLHNIGQNSSTFENSSKEVNNLKKQENRMAPFGFTQTRVLAARKLNRRMKMQERNDMVSFRKEMKGISGIPMKVVLKGELTCRPRS